MTMSHNDGRDTANMNTNDPIANMMDPPEQSLHSHFAPSSFNSNSRARANIMASSSIHNINKNARGHVYLNGDDEESHASSYAGGISRSSEPIMDNSVSRSTSSALDKYVSNYQNQQSTDSIKEDASGIYSSCSSKRSNSLLPRSFGGGGGDSSFNNGSNNYQHFNQRLQNSEVVNTTSLNSVGLNTTSSYGGYNGAHHRRDMQNHPKTGLPAKKDKDSDLEALGGYSNHPNRVKFADQMFGPRSDQKSNYSAPWRDRSISSSNASVGSSYIGSSSGGSVGSEHSKSSIDSRGDPSSYSANLTALNHRIRQYGYLKKKAVLLAVVAALMLSTIVSYLTGSLPGMTGSGIMDAQRGLADQQLLANEHDTRAPARGIMDNVHPVMGEGMSAQIFNEQQQQQSGSVDWSKVPPHLRGYYSKIVGGGQQQPRGVVQEQPPQQTQQQEQQSPEQQLLQIQNEIINAQAKAIQSVPESMAVPAIDLKEFERQQEELERNAGTGLEEQMKEPNPKEDVDEVTRQQLEASRQRAEDAEKQRIAEEEAYQKVVEEQSKKEQEAEAAEKQQQQAAAAEAAKKVEQEAPPVAEPQAPPPPAAAEEPPPPPAMELPTEASPEKAALEEAQRIEAEKAAAAALEEAQRIAAEEEARQKLAEEESLRKAATAEEDQRLARERVVQQQQQQQQQAEQQAKEEQQAAQQAEAEQAVEQPAPQPAEQENAQNDEPPGGETPMEGGGKEAGNGGGEDLEGIKNELQNELAELMALLGNKKL